MAFRPDAESRQQWALAYSAGSTLVAPVVIGIMIDLAAGTMPWCTVVGVFLGMAGAFATMVRMTRPKG